MIRNDPNQPQAATTNYKLLLHNISIDLQKKLDFHESKGVPDLTTVCRNYLAICGVFALSITCLRHSTEAMSHDSIASALYGFSSFVGGIILLLLFLTSGTFFFFRYFLMFLDRYNIFLGRKPWFFVVLSMVVLLLIIVAVPTNSAISALTK